MSNQVPLGASKCELPASSKAYTITPCIKTLSGNRGITYNSYPRVSRGCVNYTDIAI